MVDELGTPIFFSLRTVDLKYSETDHISVIYYFANAKIFSSISYHRNSEKYTNILSFIDII